MAKGSDFVVNSTPLGTYYSPWGPTVATLPDGTALIAWVTYNRDPSDILASTDTEIRARWLRADGSPAGEDFIVNSTREEFQWQPTATATADGKVFLAWDSGDGGDGDGVGVRGVLLDPLALEAGPDFQINPTSIGEGIYNGQENQQEVSLAALADGRLFAVWSSYDGSDGDSYAVRGRFFGADGLPAGDDFLVNGTGSGAQFSPDVTVLSDGRILVTYVSSANENGETRLLGRFIGADGTMAAGEVIFGTTSGGWIYAPEVTALGNGDALAVWFASGPRIEDPEGGNPTFGLGAVRARIIGSDGQPRGDDFVVNSTSLDFPYARPAVTTLTDGRVLVVWHSGDSADGDWGTLRGRVVGADGALIETDFVINSTPVNNQSTPSVAALADGRVLISWTSDDALTGGPVTRGVYITPDVGTAGADRITGSSVQDIQMGLGGNDRLSGGGGDDQLMGGEGRDSLIGGAGSDMLDGGAGRDVLRGGDGQDMLSGGAGNDMLDGGTGRDVLKGGVGADMLSGGAGRDSLRGGAGDDTLTGGAGNDVLAGGVGADVFVFAEDSGRDRVTDFAAGDLLKIDVDGWEGSTTDFLAEHATAMASGVLIVLSATSDILLAGVGATDSLADALLLI